MMPQSSGVLTIDLRKVAKLVGMRTYIYFKGKGCVHINAAGAFVGREYYHRNRDWPPPADWPYQIVDNRKKNKEKEKRT